MVQIKNMGTAEFERRMKEQKIVCFCAGYGLRELCEVYPLLPDQICYVVDNYCEEPSIVLGSYNIPVKSMREVGKNIQEALILITSLQYADEVIRQMDEEDVCDDLKVYVPAMFQPDSDHIVLKSDSKKVIPKIIHYCWFGKGDIPERFQRNIESWKKVCYDYEVVRWDESNYDYRKNGYMRQAYEAKKWGFVPDYARLDIVNTYGGIYLDTDIELMKSLEDFRQYELFCGFEDVWSVNFGLGFGGTAGNPILREMMNLYDETDFRKQDGSLNLIASPVYQTKILTKHGLLRNGSSQMHDHFAVFSPEYFSPFNAYGYGKVTENTYSIHQYAATWFGDKQKSIKARTAESVKFVMGRME